jgi:hypothetical protein
MNGYPVGNDVPEVYGGSDGGAVKACGITWEQRMRQPGLAGGPPPSCPAARTDRADIVSQRGCAAVRPSAAGAVPGVLKSRTAATASPVQQPDHDDYQDNQTDGTNPPAGSHAPVKATAAAEKEQQHDQNQQ